MNEDLAFIIGALVSEGHFNKYKTGISNSEPVYLQKISDAFKKVFDLNVRMSEQKNKGKDYLIYGVAGKQNKDRGTVFADSATLSEWFCLLGLVPSKGNSARSKILPWSIMQADYKSQRAFMAAYIEGDGSIRKDRREINVWSKSKPLLSHMQLLMAAHGIMTKKSKDCLRTSSTNDAVKLYAMIKPYLTFKQCTMYESMSGRPVKTEGLLSKPIKTLFKQRRISGNIHGTVFENDEGKNVIIHGFAKSRIGNRLLYTTYENGGYDRILSVLKKVSKIAYNRTISLLKAKYVFSPVKSIKSIKKQKVYDLSIANNQAPAFVANGVVVHNSFAACVSHLEEIGDDVIPVIDALLEVVPNPKEPCSYTDIYDNILLPLVDEFNIKYVGADRWNSIMLLQKFEQDRGIEHTQYSVTYKDMLEVREAINAQRIIFPKGEMTINDAFALSMGTYPQCFIGKPVTHCMIQMLTVEDIMNKKVDKGRGYTDDLFRAFVLNHALLIDKEVQETFLSDKPQRTGPRTMGVVASYGSGNGASRGGGSGGGGGSTYAVTASYGANKGSSGGGGGNTFSRGNSGR
jgi:hypothetical protein